MADQNPSPKAQDPRGRDSDLEPTVHPCDRPGLGPRAFLLSIMHDPRSRSPLAWMQRRGSCASTLKNLSNQGSRIG
jgi:hypothetical protein